VEVRIPEKRDQGIPFQAEQEVMELLLPQILLSISSEADHFSYHCWHHLALTAVSLCLIFPSGVGRGKMMTRKVDGIEQWLV
jgi:hypothetical protein